MKQNKYTRTIRTLFLSLVLMIGFSAAAQENQPGKPRLLVGIKIDGLKTERLNQWSKSFSVGGFRKMTAEGLYFDNVLHPIVSSGNSADIATIMSGTYPFYHGVSSNHYFDRKERMVRSVLYDSNQTGIGTPEKYSAHNLLVSTLTDEMLMHWPEARAHSVAVDAASAIMLGGHAANSVSWIDKQAKRWVTTGYYTRGLNRWADLMNVGGSFKKNQSDNSLVTELALSLIDKEQLGMSLRHTDAVFIQYSLLADNKFNTNNGKSEQDRYFDLDNNLQQLFYAIDHKYGTHNVIYFIIGGTSDFHAPEELGRNFVPAGYFNAEKALALLNTYLMAIYGHEKWVLGYYGKNLYLNKAKFEEKKINFAEVSAQIAEFLGEFEGVHSAYTADEIRAFSGNKNDIRSKLQNSFFKKVSGDVVLALKPGWLEVDNEGRMVDETNRPHPKMIFYLLGKGVNQGGTVKKQFESVDIAPTLTYLLGIPEPSASVGKVMEW